MQCASPIPLVRIPDGHKRSARRFVEPTTSPSSRTSAGSPPFSSGGGSPSYSIAKHVLLPAAKAAYVPNLRPTPKLLTRSTPHVQPRDLRNENVILAKHLLIDGSITFAVGLRYEGSVNREPDEIPLNQILSHVTPRELERFETTEFIKEDEQEEEYLRLAALRKPKGRPVGWRAEMGLTYAEFVEMNGGLLQSSETENVHQRPVPSGPKVASLRRRGRPRVYSMVAAAGLGFESGDQDETSRDITPNPVVNNASVDVGGPPSKKRRTVNRAASRSKQFSPSVILDSEAEAPTNFSKPMVVVSSQDEPRPLSAGLDERSALLTRRRCQRCKNRRQGCSGDKPCRCCTDAGIGPDGCRSEDEVQPRAPRSTQSGAATHSSSQFHRGNKLSRQPPSFGSSNHNSSKSDDDSEIGSTIFVEDVQPKASKFAPLNVEWSESDNDSEIGSTIVIEDVQQNKASNFSPRQGSPELEPSLEMKSSRLERPSAAPVVRPLSAETVPISPTLTAPLAQSLHSSPPRSLHLELDLDHEQAGRSRYPLTANDLDSTLLLSERKRPSESPQFSNGRPSSTKISDSFSPKANYFSPFHKIQKYFTKTPTSTTSGMSSVGAMAINPQQTLQAQQEAASMGIKVPLNSLAFSQTLSTVTQTLDPTNTSFPSEIQQPSEKTKQQNSASILDATEAAIDDDDFDTSFSSGSTIFPHETIIYQSPIRGSSRSIPQWQPTSTEISSSKRFVDGPSSGP